MEHQILPRGASFTPNERRIPYLGRKDYLGVPFLDYPARAGYGPLLLNPRLLEKTPPSLEFLQTWLFFGWLQEVLGHFVTEVTGSSLYEHDDFLRNDETPPVAGTSSVHDSKEPEPSDAERLTEQLITTAKLNQRLKEWRSLIRPEVARLEQQFNKLYATICAFERVLLLLPILKAEPPDNHKLSLYSTIEALELCIDDVFSGQPYHESCKSPPLSLFPKDDRVRQMKDIGWCPFHALQAIQKSVTLQVALYIEKIDRRGNPILNERHQSCTTLGCNVIPPPHGSNHRRPACACSEVCLDQEGKIRMLSMLEMDMIPLLCLKKKSGVIIMDVVEATPAAKYVALSHVWADGLGNDEANAVRQCQLSYIFDKLDVLSSTTGDPTREHLIWLDTICIPKGPSVESLRKKAIVLMRKTYQDAEEVLALDAELEMAKSDDLDLLEILARITYCGWTRRLWTLQEVFFAKRLCVQFLDKAIDMDQLLKDLEGSARQFSVQRLYVHLKTSYFGMRMDRALNPASPQFPIHTLAMTAPGRLTEHDEDEPTCLSSLLGLPLDNLLSVPKGERMHQFWRLLSASPTKIPDYIIFKQCQRSSQKGFQWAPLSLLKSQILQIAITSEGRAAEIHPEGLQVTFPGIQLSPAIIAKKVTPLNRPTYMRTNDGKWYNLYIPVPLSGELPKDYAEHAIIFSRTPSTSKTPGHATLVRIHENRGTTKFVNCVSPIPVPPLVEATSRELAKIFEAVFQYLPKWGSAMINQEEGTLVGAGEEILKGDPSLHDSLQAHHRSLHGQAIQEIVEMFLGGVIVAAGTHLPDSQRWIVD